MYFQRGDLELPCTVGTFSFTVVIRRSLSARDSADMETNLLALHLSSVAVFAFAILGSGLSSTSSAGHVCVVSEADIGFFSK